MDRYIHTAEGTLVSLLVVPGTKVRRKKDLGYAVRREFPLGFVTVVKEDCGFKRQTYSREHLNREITHVVSVKGECFHPYQDTLEVVEDG